MSETGKMMKGAAAAAMIAAALSTPVFGGAKSDAGADRAKPVTISFYPDAANAASGVVGGFKGELFASRGFALDVWSYSAEKTNAILASGDLPDVMYVADKNRDVMIEGNMLLNLDDYLSRMPHVEKLPYMSDALSYARQYRSGGTGHIYGIPTLVGENNYRFTTIDSTDRRALKLKWDVYEKIGAPPINDVWGLIDVMEQMVKAQPKDAAGNPYYGTILNNGSDTTYWACMVLFYYWFGVYETHLPYLLEANMITGELKSILDNDSLYREGLKWYNAVYRRGLMDPDSINLDRATQKAKVDAGFGMVPSGNLPGWAAGNYYQYLLPGTNIYFATVSHFGNSTQLAVNAKLKNSSKLDAALAVIDTFADPDAQLIWRCGPEGDFWYADGKGNAFFTDAGLAYLRQNKNWPGYQLKNGEKLELWNIGPAIAQLGAPTSYKDGQGNPRIVSTMEWRECIDINTDNDVFRQWQKTTGYKTWNDWLSAKKAYYYDGPLQDLVGLAQPSDDMQLIISALRDTVVTASWKMVYAADDAEFDKLWTKMVADCQGLGAQKVIDWRRADVKKAQATRDAVLGKK